MAMAQSANLFTVEPSAQLMPDGRTVAQAIADSERKEWKAGYPHASEAEIQLLMDAEKITGYPPHNLDMAKALMKLPSEEQQRFWKGMNKAEKAAVLAKVGYYGVVIISVCEA